MRPIDADALKGEKFYSHERHEYCVSVYAIDTMPTVEPDRPHGEWKYVLKLRLVDETDDGAIYETAMKCFCSACGADFGFQKVDDAFCKYCGSDNRPKEGE